MLSIRISLSLSLACSLSLVFSYFPPFSSFATIFQLLLLLLHDTAREKKSIRHGMNGVSSEH
jgi:hypothetical protein